MTKELSGSSSKGYSRDYPSYSGYRQVLKQKDGKFKQNDDQYKEMLKQKRGSRGGKSRHNDGDKYGHREFDKENVKLYNADIPDKSKRQLTTEKEEGKKNKDF